MTVKKVIAVIIATIFSLPWGEGRGGVSAQQIGMYSHYFYKPMAYNPAFTGADDDPNAMLLSRAQWANFKGAPQLTLFTANGSFMDKKVGLGLSLINDRKGITSRTGGAIYYSYRFSLNDDMNIALGASAGVADQSIDFSKALVETPSDPTLYADAQHKTAFDANAGVLFSWKELKIGAGVPQLFANKLKSVNNVDSSNARAYYTHVRHCMASAQYKVLISEDKGMSVTPLALVRIVPGAPLQYDGTVTFEWQDKFWVGATYKSNYAVAANVGFCLHKQLCIGYAYDVIIGNIGKYAGISHEIMVNFKLAKNKKSGGEVQSGQQGNGTNADYEQQLEQLQTQLDKNQKKLKELSDKLDKQENAPQQTAPSQGNKPGTLSSDGIFVTKRSDFKDDRGQMAANGYYVVVGIFFYRDFADEEVKNFAKKGFKNSSLVYSESKKNNYVFVDRLDTKEEAFAKAKELNAADSSNAWILNLTD